MPAIPSGVDWTPLWYKELSIHAAYAYGQESFGGRTRATFEIALELLSEQGSGIRGLVGAPFELHDYRAALSTALNTGSSRSIKTVFGIRPR